MSQTIISTDRAPQAIGPYSQAIKVGSTVYCSGQIGLDPRNMELADGVHAQAKQVFENLRAVLQAAGGDLGDVVKVTVFLPDLANYALINQVMTEYFTEPYPARAAVGVAALPKDAAVEVDAIAELS